MSTSLGILFTFIGVMYIVAQVLLIGVAIFFWKRYPRPSLYLAIMATLEVAGGALQQGLQLVMSWGAIPNVDFITVHAMTSLVRFAAHIIAMCFLVLAVYVARRPSTPLTSSPSPLPGTPGMENGDQAFLLDPKNPYSPPRQPR